MRPWKIEKADSHASRVSFAGEVNEHAELPSLLREIDGPSVVLDLENVTRINSVGVHQWIQFLSELEKRGNNFVLEKCSVPIVMQLNMIREFRGAGQVRSIQAPYFCAVCNADRFRLVDLTAKTLEIPDTLDCPKCGSQMCFDDDLEAFLSFRRN